MIVSKINSISFLGKIIDTHAHIGHFGEKHHPKEELDIFTKEPLPNKDTVEKMLVSDLDILFSKSSEYDRNKELLKILDKDKYLIIASCSPKDGDVHQIEKLFQEYPNRFVGLKFHPSIQNLETTRAEYKPYLEFAQKHKIPCLFHSEVITDSNGKLVKELSISDPEKIYSLAKNYSKAPVVMAHMGAGWREAHDKAIDILVQSIKNGDANLYADISWVDIDTPELKGSHYRPKDHITKAIKTLKGIGDSSWTYGDQSFRLLFGSDAPLARFKISDNKNAVNDYTKFIEDIKKAIREDADLKADAEKIIDDIFYNNAEKLYINRAKINTAKQLKTITDNFSDSEKHSFKVKLAACLLIIGAGIINSFRKTNSALKSTK